MVCVNNSEEINEASQLFEANSNALSKKLLTSENGKSREAWDDEIFKTLSAEDIIIWDKQRAELLKGGNANIRKFHRPDLD